MLHLAILANAANYHLHRWLPALSARGIRVSLISFVEPSASIQGVEFHRMARPTRFIWKHTLADFLLGTRNATRLLQSLNPDVLMGSYATNYGFMAARTGRHPFVLQTWTADVQLYPSVGPKKLILGPMVRRSLREADLVTTDGPALLEELVRSFPSCAGRAEGILWGIELEQYLNLPERRSKAREDLLIPQDAVVITNARGLRIHDRPEVSLPALERVLDSRANVHVNVLTLGHQPEEAITGVLARLRAHPRCRIFDRFLSKNAVRDVWAASDLVVSVPLFDGISETLLEAMAAGCIPVLSEIPPNRIIVPDPDNAIFTRADAPETLVDDILEGLDRLDELRESAVPANKAWVRENASIDQAADRLAGLLRGLVEKETE